ncbi:putative proliferating cell nuclear antigen [Neospora caninum Liverpool]|uniref:Putative proliferating cell nuclear antigen n=1 Tax=Neospora caninum (strain Liverpool) TaxID=572307 RepID=F0VA56_NEOCL|nr:putative proliferating cell nuclear antigen [Neospora caninum Liverpool]CBZ50545.1 putative proliferating cell nuclear antigen [Neospora caninum Liverpool]|eukprot:XP_003880578.1 putative proliferating cell nuclear antigen [Neospora caninum Liverpool]
MFECTIEGLLLKRLMECLKEMVTDVNLICNAGGISLDSMDGSHVAVVDVRLDVDLFHKYRCDRPVQLGLSVPNLLLALQPVKSAETLVHLSSLHGDDEDDEEDTILHINIEDPESGDTWSMEVRLLDVESEQLEVPEHTEHEATAVVRSKELQDLVRYLNSLSESIVVKMDKTHMQLSARGDSVAASRKMQPEVRKRNFVSFLSLSFEGGGQRHSCQLFCDGESSKTRAFASCVSVSSWSLLCLTVSPLFSRVFHFLHPLVFGVRPL